MPSNIQNIFIYSLNVDYELENWIWSESYVSTVHTQTSASPIILEIMSLHHYILPKCWLWMNCSLKILILFFCHLYMHYHYTFKWIKYNHTLPQCQFWMDLGLKIEVDLSKMSTLKNVVDPKAVFLLFLHALRISDTDQLSHK
jgi:hypothetical protein